MIEKQLFDLEKIREITDPLQALQGKLSNLEEINDNVSEMQKKITQDKFGKELINQFQEILKILKDINNKLKKHSNENINKFLVFRDELIKKYKDSFKEDLKYLNLNQEFMKTIGLFLIENKKISKIIDRSSYIPALTLDIWLDLIESLKANSLFISTIKKIHIFYDYLLREKLKLELNKIPDDINPVLIEDFKKTYKKDPLTFQEFLENVETKLTAEEFDKKRQIIEETKEKEKLKQLQKRQEKQQQSYQDYFTLSDEEFKRRRRKEKRKSLKEITTEPKDIKEMSDEVSEKIEKFKSEMDKRFQEEFIIKKDEDTDPLDLIRERRKKKTEEYKKFIKKFENEE